MSGIFHVHIVTPDEVVYSGDATSLVVSAQLGYLGILAHHLPLVAHLVKGKIILKDGTGNTKIFQNQSQGFVEVLNNYVTLILNQ